MTTLNDKYKTFVQLKTYLRNYYGSDCTPTQLLADDCIKQLDLTEFAILMASKEVSGELLRESITMSLQNVKKISKISRVLITHLQQLCNDPDFDYDYDKITAGDIFTKSGLDQYEIQLLVVNHKKFLENSKQSLPEISREQI